MTAPVTSRSAADGAHPLIELRGMSVSYGPDTPPALSGVDLAISRGEVVAILGANGSGKSTLLRAILGLVPTSPPIAATRARTGYVPQRQTVGGGVPATVEEVVATGRLLRRRLLPPLLPPVERGIVCDAIATVGLTEKIGSPVSELSGGQQRRVLIARALASEPEVLLMDEPFAGVDAANQEILAATFAELIRAGTTLVIVTHEIGPIRDLVRRTVIVDHGRITYDGPPVASGPGAVDESLHDPCAHPNGRDGGRQFGEPI